MMPTWNKGLDGEDPRWEVLSARAVDAEAAGFASLWVGEGLMFDDDYLAVRDPPGCASGDFGLLDCWTLLAALAQVTSRMALGSLVTANSYRAPAVLAKTVQTVDELAGHRVTLGIGAGAYERAHVDFGLDFERRFARFEEALPILRGLLRGETVSLEGDHYTVSGSRLTPRRPASREIPILIGGAGSRSLRMAADHADAWNGWLAWDVSTPERLRPLLDRLDKACERRGRDPATLERSAALGVRLGGAPLRAGHAEVGDGAITGDVDAVGEALARFAEMGLHEVQLHVAPFTAETISAMRPLTAAFPPR